MKIEKVDDNKVKITLSFEELEMRNITLSDIEKNNAAAKNLFTSLIEETNLDEDFQFENSQLFIEASADNNNTFILTITKIEDLPDINKYSRKNPKVLYKIDSHLFEFSSLDVILDFCKIAKEENLFFGKNTLYKYNDKYFILFSETAVKNKKFIKTYVMLSEYCSRYFSYDLFYTTIKEKGLEVIANRAIQKLMKI
ncbi:MAG: adaptor protein MecA [Clostridia bacterium]|nr:adaptor protein MecA [Clostridia bacterium]